MSILSGLPPLSISVRSVFNSVAARAGLTLNNPFSTPPQPIWGVFDSSGNAVLVAESMISFDYRNDWDIPNYPQEEGAFASYNKVNRPYDIRIRLSQGGTEDERSSFLTKAQEVSESLNLYDVVTPEVTYSDCNVVHIDYHRDQREGATRIVLDVWLQEIRQSTTETGAMTEETTQSVNSPEVVISGQVQAFTPSALLSRLLG